MLYAQLVEEKVSLHSEVNSANNILNALLSAITSVADLLSKKGFYRAVSLVDVILPLSGIRHVS